MSELTIAAGPVRALLDFAAAKGADRAMLAREAGTDVHDLADQDRRLPFAKYVALMRAAKRLVRDPALALHFGEAVDVSEFSILGLLGPDTPSVVDAFAHFNRYVRLVIEVDLRTPERFELARSDDGLWLVDTRLNPNDFFELTESTFARIARGVGIIAHKPLVKAVHVTHADPGYRSEYERIFGSQVSFESDSNAMLLDERLLAERVPSERPYVYGVLRSRADALLKRLDNEKTTRGRVESLLLPQLHTGRTDASAIAAEMGMSRWTLLRRLKAEGATFDKVLNELRHRAALHYLNSKVSVSETAYLVGFSEPAAFSRAFRRWTGRSPGELRSARRQARAK